MAKKKRGSNNSSNNYLLFIALGVLIVGGIAGVLLLNNSGSSGTLFGKAVSYGDGTVRSFRFQAGWNLVHGFLTPVDIVDGDGYVLERGQLNGQRLSGSNIKAVWLFSPKSINANGGLGDYVRLYPNPDFSVIQDLDDLYPDSDGSGSTYEHLLFNSPLWVYSDITKTSNYALRDLNDLHIDGNQLYAGWNFVSVTPDDFPNDKDGKFVWSDMVGDCTILDMYYYDTLNNKWVSVDPNERLDYEDYSYRGFIVKVSDDCSLGRVADDSSTTIPDLPGASSSSGGGGGGSGTGSFNVDFGVSKTVNGNIFELLGVTVADPNNANSIPIATLKVNGVDRVVSKDTFYDNIGGLKIFINNIVYDSSGGWVSVRVDGVSDDVILFTSSENELSISAVLTTGTLSNFPIYRGNNTPTIGTETYLSGPNGKRIWTQNGAEISEGDYFILRNGGNSITRLLRLDSVRSGSTSSNKYVTVTDVASGSATGGIWSHDGASGTMTYDGTVHAFTISGDQGTMSFDSGLSNELVTAKGTRIFLTDLQNNNILINYLGDTPGRTYDDMNVLVHYSEGATGTDVTMNSHDEFQASRTAPDSPKVEFESSADMVGEGMTTLEIQIHQN